MGPRESVTVQLGLTFVQLIVMWNGQLGVTTGSDMFKMAGATPG